MHPVNVGFMNATNIEAEKEKIKRKTEYYNAILFGILVGLLFASLWDLPSPFIRCDMTQYVRIFLLISSLIGLKIMSSCMKNQEAGVYDLLPILIIIGTVCLFIVLSQTTLLCGETLG